MRDREAAQSAVSVGCGVVVGVDAVPVRVEATMRGEHGAPKILGSVDHVVREAYHRVLCAFAACGLPVPRGAPLLNLTPAGLRKSGPCYDLPMALALAGAGGLLGRERLRAVAAFGEITLDGRVLPARGVVAVALAVRDRGWGPLLVSPADAAAARVVPGIEVVAVPSLRDAIAWLATGQAPACVPVEPARPAPPVGGDLADLRGHETPKTALVVAAAGRHNLLLVGPPGSGKTALVRRLPGLLPPIDEGELLDVLKIHSAHGAGGRAPAHRPLRAPHHSSSMASVLGGGPDVRPGEVTLAQHGALFLDELPEFRREVLEALRQPLEDGIVTIGRAARTVTMPADFLLVAAMNPCPCGYAGDRRRPCVCSPPQRHRYRAKVSGPLLDRIDLQVEVPALTATELRAPADPGWSTAAQRERILLAVDRQRQRGGADGWRPNARLEGRGLERAVAAPAAALDALDRVIAAYRLSARARVRLLRTARTLADLRDADRVGDDDIMLAARLRSFAFAAGP